jgi:hypothetical protein
LQSARYTKSISGKKSPSFSIREQKGIGGNRESKRSMKQDGRLKIDETVKSPVSTFREAQATTKNPL